MASTKDIFKQVLNHFESIMNFNETQLKILVILSDENGYSNNDLAKELYGNKSYRGNISNALKPLRKKNEVVEILESTTNYEEYNLHIKVDKDVFASIVTQLDGKASRYDLESAKISREYKRLNERGGWADNRMMNFLVGSQDCLKSCEYFSKALAKFIYSQYTGKIIKEYGFEVVRRLIPMMKVNDFIKFLDWAEEKYFIEEICYINIVLSLSDFMQQEFEKKSEKYAYIMRLMHE
jgi:hypothetical protein